jgi:hypothetical protein
MILFLRELFKNIDKKNIFKFFGKIKNKYSIKSDKESKNCFKDYLLKKKFELNNDVLSTNEKSCLKNKIELNNNTFEIHSNENNNLSHNKFVSFLENETQTNCFYEIFYNNKNLTMSKINETMFFLDFEIKNELSNIEKYFYNHVNCNVIKKNDVSHVAFIFSKEIKKKTVSKNINKIYKEIFKLNKVVICKINTNNNLPIMETEEQIFLIFLFFYYNYISHMVEYILPIVKSLIYKRCVLKNNLLDICEKIIKMSNLNFSKKTEMSKETEENDMFELIKNHF